MSLIPILNAPLMVQIHVTLAAVAIVLTGGIFGLPKGSAMHKSLGWLWVIMMAGIALSSFWIHAVRWIGPFSPIHLLSVLVLCTLYTGVTPPPHHLPSTRHDKPGRLWPDHDRRADLHPRPHHACDFPRRLAPQAPPIHLPDSRR